MFRTRRAYLASVQSLIRVFSSHVQLSIKGLTSSLGVTGRRRTLPGAHDITKYFKVVYTVSDFLVSACTSQKNRRKNKNK